MASTATKRLSDSEITLLTEPNIADLATLMPDGSPQVTPVWIDYEDGLILVNTAEGRVKHRNVGRDPRVALSIFDASSPYEDVFWTKGRVVEITTDGAKEHIDKLTKKYIGKDVYPWHQADEQRVILKIQPEQ
ncbi:MAG: PPOX class F420-dependent oxidoreductase [Actinomycetota bacterium]